MKSLHILFVLPVILLAVSGNFAADARIKIDPDRVIGEISPMIYGNLWSIWGGVCTAASMIRAHRCPTRPASGKTCSTRHGS